MLKIVKEIVKDIIEFFVTYTPGGLGNWLRYQYYKKKIKKIGRNVIIDQGTIILNPEYVSINDNTWIDKYVLIVAGPPKNDRNFIIKKNINYVGAVGEVYIGKNCHIGPFTLIQGHGGVWIGNNVGITSGCKIYSMSHHYKSKKDIDKTVYKFTTMAPPEEQCLIIGPVVLSDNSALGLNSVVLPGSTIGKNSWVGVNSTVIGEIPPNSIAIGNPAKVMKRREVQDYENKV